ncbi:hypothetical protein ACPPVT_10645 [Angustibacter sp. McL0619]|uniref:hypothetical protein n=1 Tax=Angustibacter sp. McL0619 TaxID=3415676 RepID=UPI003CEA2966
MNQRSLVALVLLPLLGSALAGCSVPVQASPVVVRSVRPGSSPPSPAGSPQPSVRVQAYFVQDGHLVALDRFVPAADGLAPSLSALAQPLTPAQSAAGVRSALPTRLQGWTGRLRDTVAQVAVPTGFDRLSVPEQVLAVAQVVFTVTANSYASGVELLLGDRVVAMPDEDGQLVTGPLMRADFARLSPP